MILYNNINKEFLNMVEEYDADRINYESVCMPDIIIIKTNNGEDAYYKGSNSHIALIDNLLKGIKIPFKGIQRIVFKYNNKYFGVNYSIIKIERETIAEDRQLLGFAELDYYGEIKKGTLVVVDSIYTVKKGIGIAKYIVDAIKTIAGDNPVMVEAGYIYKEDYEASNDAIDKAIQFWSSQGFKDVNRKYGGYEEKLTMLFRK